MRATMRVVKRSRSCVCIARIGYNNQIKVSLCAYHADSARRVRAIRDLKRITKRLEVGAVLVT